MFHLVVTAEPFASPVVCSSALDITNHNGNVLESGYTAVESPQCELKDKLPFGDGFSDLACRSLSPLETYEPVKGIENMCKNPILDCTAFSKSLQNSIIPSSNTIQDLTHFKVNQVPISVATQHTSNKSNDSTPTGPIKFNQSSQFFLVLNNVSYCIYLDMSSLSLRPAYREIKCLPELISTTRYAAVPSPVESVPRIPWLETSNFTQSQILSRMALSQASSEIYGAPTNSTTEDLPNERPTLPPQRSHLLLLLGVPNSIPPVLLLSILDLSVGTVNQNQQSRPTTALQSIRILKRACSMVHPIETKINTLATAIVVDFYSCILVFSSQKDADAFYWKNHGTYFETLYSNYCCNQPCNKVEFLNAVDNENKLDLGITPLNGLEKPQLPSDSLFEYSQQQLFRLQENITFGCCYVIHLSSITYRDNIQIAQRTSSNETNLTTNLLLMPPKGLPVPVCSAVPTCPVCLERIDVSVFGIVTRSVAWMAVGPENNRYLKSCATCCRIHWIQQRLSSTKIDNPGVSTNEDKEQSDIQVANKFTHGIRRRHSTTSTRSQSFSRFNYCSRILVQTDTSKRISRGYGWESDSEINNRISLPRRTPRPNTHEWEQSTAGSIARTTFKTSINQCDDFNLGRTLPEFLDSKNTYETDLKKLSKKIKGVKPTSKLDQKSWYSLFPSSGTCIEPAESSCSQCLDLRESWICLICGHLGCGRYKKKHAQRHAHELGHRVCLQVSTGHIWDYGNEVFVHRRVVYPKSSAVDGLYRVIRLPQPATNSTPDVSIGSSVPTIVYKNVPYKKSTTCEKKTNPITHQTDTLEDNSFTKNSNRKLNEKQENSCSVQEKNALTPQLAANPINCSNKIKRHVTSPKLKSSQSAVKNDTEENNSSERTIPAPDCVKNESVSLIQDKKDYCNLTTAQLENAYNDLCCELELMLASQLEFQRMLYVQKLRENESEHWEKFNRILLQCESLNSEIVSLEETCISVNNAYDSLRTKNRKLQQLIDTKKNDYSISKELNNAMVRRLQAAKNSNVLITNEICSRRVHPPESASSSYNAKTGRRDNPSLDTRHSQSTVLLRLDEEIAELEKELATLLEDISKLT